MVKNPVDYYKDKPIHNVLMVCLGNICRSPSAEYLLRDKLVKADIPDILVSSAGLLDMEGREPAEEMTNILMEVGINMSGHRSRKLSGRLIMENELIIVMEIKQKEEIASALPALADKVWLLSQFAPVPEERDIRDPYGKETFHFKNCYNEMYFLIEELARFLMENNFAFRGR